jgi:hypothetical protein
MTLRASDPSETSTLSDGSERGQDNGGEELRFFSAEYVANPNG